MKKILVFAGIAMIALATFAGCTKKSDSPSYFMKATLGATAYNAGNCIASTSPLGTGIVVSGLGGGSTTPTYPYVSLIISSFANATGTFSFDSTQATNYAQYLTSTTAYKISKSGTVTITSTSASTVSGTFSFTCTDGTSVSGGSFTAKRY